MSMEKEIKKVIKEMRKESKESKQRINDLFSKAKEDLKEQKSEFY
jgi:hypothetical protein